MGNKLFLTVFSVINTIAIIGYLELNGVIKITSNINIVFGYIGLFIVIFYLLIALVYLSFLGMMFAYDRNKIKNESLYFKLVLTISLILTVINSVMSVIFFLKNGDS
ncbi:MAG: hypothetical protein NTY74_05745 [Ignavibacteriae bacterium]|nr:hypothetical protein [Ignavibacteriota bacterium]